MAGLTYRFAFVGSASDKVFVTKVLATSDVDIQDILEAAARKFKLPAEHSGLLDLYRIHGVEPASEPSKAQCDEALTYPRVHKTLRPTPESFPAEAWYLINTDLLEGPTAALAGRAAAPKRARAPDKEGLLKSVLPPAPSDGFPGEEPLGATGSNLRLRRGEAGKEEGDGGRPAPAPSEEKVKSV